MKTPICFRQKYSHYGEKKSGRRTLIQMKGGIVKIYYSLGEVARLLDVRPHRIVYLHTVAKAVEPERIFGNRAYTWSDVLKLAEHFGVTIEALETGKRP